MKITEIFQPAVTAMLMESIPHPEDAIWTKGVSGAAAAVEDIAQMQSGKQLTTIKWDGFPAVIFGRGQDGQLIVSDKHMFDKKDGSGRVTSPAAFQQYDVNRGANRSDLYSKINLLWPALESIIPGNFRGFYFGDLLYAGRLRPVEGFYTFKPNTVTYRVPEQLGGKVNPIAATIAASVAGIAVHTFIPDIGQPDQPLDGLGGLPAAGAPVWFVTGEMPVPSIKIAPASKQAVLKIISEYDAAVTQFLADLSGIKAKGIIGLASKYITSKITAGSFDNMLQDFLVYLNGELSPGANQKLLDNGNGWLYNQGQQGLQGMFAIWVALYNFKIQVKKQIDAQQASGAIQAYTGTEPGHEGYVVGGGTDKFKIIDRLEFSRANFAKNN